GAGTLEPRALQQLEQRRSADVLARPGRDTVADRDHVRAVEQLTLPGPRAPARFFQQPHRFEIDTALDALRHVDQGQARDRRRGQRLHLDAGLTYHARLRRDAHTTIDELEVHAHARQRQRVTQRY